MSERWNPKPYQVKAVSWLVKHGAAGLFLDPGLGKTSINLMAIKTLKEIGELRPGKSFLVIAPLRPCYLVWPAEVEKWTQFNGLRIEVLHGSKKDEAFRRPADIQVINPAGIPWLLSKVNPRKWPWHGLSIDESTQYKRANTQRFKLLRPVLPLFHRRWINTGTPAPNGLLDLFGQIYVLDLGAALGRYITHYRRNYFAPTGYGGYTWVPQKDAEQKIYRRIEPLILRMSEVDYLKLPPVVGNFDNPKHPPNLHKVTLPPAARKIYDQLETLFFTELKNGSVTAANAGVQSMKLSQVANGGIYYDKGDEAADDVKVRGATRRWALIHEAKTEAVVELLDELSGKPALIAYDFHHDLARLRQHRDLRNIPAMDGTMADNKRIEAAWNAGEFPAIFVNAQSIAHGLNLQGGGRAVIWHSMTWNWEHYWQLIKRVWRQGQTKRTFVYHVVAVDTIDEVKCATLASKGTTQGALLCALRAYSFRRPTRR